MCHGTAALPPRSYAYKDGNKPNWTVKMTPDNAKDPAGAVSSQLLEALDNLALQLLPASAAPPAAAVRKKPPPAVGIHLQAEVLQQRGPQLQGGLTIGWALKTGISKCSSGAAVEVKLQSLPPQSASPARASQSQQAAAPGPPPSLYGGGGCSGQQLEDVRVANVDAVNAVLGRGRVRGPLHDALHCSALLQGSWQCSARLMAACM